jgi:hypothetical protein
MNSQFNYVKKFLIFSLDSSNRSLPRLVKLVQNVERSSDILFQLNNENEELKHRNKETNQIFKY